MRAILTLASILTIALISGCELEDAGPLVTDSRSVKQGGAKSVEVKLDQAVGGITVTGGAKDLMDAEFRYNVPSWKPEIEYTVNNGKGSLVVRQPRESNIRFKNTHNHWDVHLRDVLPMSLEVRSATGSLSVRPNGLDLISLTVDGDTGQANVDLAGLYPSLESVDVQTNTGGVDAKLNGSYPELTRLKLDSDTGSVTADLSGRWESNVSGEISTDTGSIEVILPKNVGASVTAHTDTGRVHGHQVVLNGGVYSNGKTPVLLHLNVHTNTGSITLRTSDQ